MRSNFFLSLEHCFIFFFSSRRLHTRSKRDWSSDVCSSDLTGQEKKRLTRRYTENADAYALYLRGRYHWNKRTAEDLQKGIGYFQQAIEKDPTYALAYAGLSDGYAVLFLYSGLPSSETFPKAKAAALKALEIDDSLAQAHAALAYTHEVFD